MENDISDTINEYNQIKIEHTALANSVHLNIMYLPNRSLRFTHKVPSSKTNNINIQLRYRGMFLIFMNLTKCSYLFEHKTQAA